MRRRLPVLLVGLALTMLTALLYVSGWGLVDDVSNRAFDSLLRLFHQQPRSGMIVIVDIDDPSLAAYGQWPWPRSLVADLTERILADNPAVVAFDIVFAEPDRTSPLVVRDEVRTRLGIELPLPTNHLDRFDYDRTLAEVIRSQPVILGCAMRPASAPLPAVDPANDPHYRGPPLFLKGPPDTALAPHLQQADRVTVPIPRLRRAARVASFNAAPDSDNIVRSNPLIWAVGPDRLYPAMALEAVRMAAGVRQCLVTYDTQGVTGIRLADVEIPCTRSGRVVINYRSVRPDAVEGMASSFPSVPARDILDGTVPPGAFTGMIVFVGTSAVGLRDVKATPLAENFAGVEVHATVVDNIIAGDVLRRPNYSYGIEFVSVVAVGLLLTGLIAAGGSWPSLVATGALLMLLPAGSLYLLQSRHLVMLPAWPMLSVLVIFPVLTTVRYWQEERQRRRVRTMFGTMVSSDVLRYLETNPGSFSLRGERTEVTAFFSDVAGFTSISERLEPERVADLLNRYLTPMTEIIMAHSGYVDKYEGDAIMAEWGVPFRTDDHAEQACHAALEQQARLDALRPQLKEEFGQTLHVRMGINTGPVVAGNMGSHSRFSYTIMGDAVNLAARLEPTNKDYGTRIVIGETTQAAIGTAFDTRLLDRIVVAGKAQAVAIYELLGRQGETNPDLVKVARHYEEALRLHWKRDWGSAVSELDFALLAVPDDRPSRALYQRILMYMEHPPAADWGGEIIREKKD